MFEHRPDSGGVELAQVAIMRAGTGAATVASDVGA
jgi:hypothetical protein